MCSYLILFFMLCCYAVGDRTEMRGGRRNRRAEISPDAKIVKPHGGVRSKVKTCIECQIFIDIAEMQKDAQKNLDNVMKQAVEEGRRESLRREMAREKAAEGRAQSGYPFYQKEDQDMPEQLKKDQAVNECLKLPVKEQKTCIEKSKLGVKLNEPRGTSGDMPDVKVPDMPDLPSAEVPDLPDLPKLPNVPNIPPLKIPGVDALQSFLDKISSMIDALKPPKIPTLPTSINAEGRMGAMGSGLAPPPMTVGAGIGGGAGATGALSTSFNPSQDATGNLPPPPPMPSLGGGGGGGGSGSSGSGNNVVGFKESRVRTSDAGGLNRAAFRNGNVVDIGEKNVAHESLLQSMFGNVEEREAPHTPMFSELMVLLETMSKVGMVPTSPEGKRLMNPDITAGTDKDPLMHPAYNKQNNHPVGDGTTEDTTGEELFPVTSMHVCVNEQNYGIHAALLKSLFNGLPLDQVVMECTPEFGISEY